MSLKFNNREFSLGIFAPASPKEIFNELVENGISVRDTRELTNVRITIDDLISFLPSEAMSTLWRKAGAMTFEVEELYAAILANDNSLVTPTYRSEYYTFLNEEIKNAAEKFESDSIATRRAVVTFPSSHCFESIQVIHRNDLFITVNMRSCDAYKNLMNDLYLSLLIASRVVRLMWYGHISITANIGSLHIFEEDIKNVF